MKYMVQRKLFTISEMKQREESGEKNQLHCIAPFFRTREFALFCFVRVDCFSSKQICVFARKYSNWTHSNGNSVWKKYNISAQKSLILNSPNNFNSICFFFYSFDAKFFPAQMTMKNNLKIWELLAEFQNLYSIKKEWQKKSPCCEIKRWKVLHFRLHCIIF